MVGSVVAATQRGDHVQKSQRVCGPTEKNIKGKLASVTQL